MFPLIRRKLFQPSMCREFRWRLRHTAPESRITADLSERLMNFIRFLPVCASVICILTLSNRRVFAADDLGTPPPEAPKPQLIPGTYRVLEQHTLTHDGHTTIYKRISPPKLTKPPVAEPTPLTAEEQALVDSRKGKSHDQLSVGATVFDHSISEIHWSSTGGGKPHVAYSNIDFNLVAGLLAFDSADTVYSTMFAVGNVSSAERPDAASKIPALSDFPSDLSVFYLPEEDQSFTEADEAILNALDALHVYYDAHRESLRQKYLEREQKRMAQEQWIKNHPPVPKPKVIYLWKMETPTSPNQGGSKP